MTEFIYDTNYMHALIKHIPWNNGESYEKNNTLFHILGPGLWVFLTEYNKFSDFTETHKSVKFDEFIYIQYNVLYKYIKSNKALNDAINLISTIQNPSEQLGFLFINNKYQLAKLGENMYSIITEQSIEVITLTSNK